MLQGWVDIRKCYFILASMNPMLGNIYNWAKIKYDKIVALHL